MPHGVKLGQNSFNIFVFTSFHSIAAAVDVPRTLQRLFVPGTDHHLRQLLNNFFNLFPHARRRSFHSFSARHTHRDLELSLRDFLFFSTNNLSILAYFVVLWRWFNLTHSYATAWRLCTFTKSNFWASSIRRISRWLQFSFIHLSFEVSFSKLP